MLKYDKIFSWIWQNGSKNNLIYIFSLIILFFMLFDGIISYLIPLVILEQGFSKTTAGIIFSTAAIAGALFDFVIYKIFKESIYRRLFIIMFAISFLYIFTIWIANTFLLFVAAMAMWGFYYDLKNFGSIDFVSRYSSKEKLSHNFGVVQVFQSIGYLVAPLLAGLVIVGIVGWEPFGLALLFLTISAFFFVVLLIKAKNKKQFIPFQEKNLPANILKEISCWKKIGRVIFPLLLLVSYGAVYDSFFMLLGPILAERLPLEPFDGIFLFAYYLPALLMGGLVGKITIKFGKKNTAIFGLLIGSSIISTLFLFENPLILILIVFLSSCFTSLLIPVVQSIFANYIHDLPQAKKEVQELGDFFSNFGYILGPIFAGVIAETFGSIKTFSFLGGIGILFSLSLLIFLRKKPIIKTKN